MPNPTALVTKINNILNKFTPFARTVYKRIVSKTGDDLIGRATATFVDTQFTPQPIYNQIGREKLSGGHDTVQQITTASGVELTADDYEFLFSPTALVTADLTNPNMQIVLKDSLGATEVLSIMDTSTVELSGKVVIVNVFARSIKRP
jgi:hypothetical protein